MSDATFTSGDWSSDPFRRSAPIGTAALCALSVVAYAAASLWMLCVRPGVAPVTTTRPMLQARTVPTNAAPAKVAPLRFAQVFTPASEASRPILIPAARVTGLLDPDFAGRYAPSPFHAATPTPQARLETPPAPQPVETRLAAAPTEAVADVPLPLPRPAFALPEPQPSAGHRTAGLLPPPVEPVSPAPTPAQPSFFEKMFGARPANPALAYAPEDGGLPGLLGRPTSPDRFTAVYNIASHTVTLPDGRRLEAHSGLGARLDDPGSVTEHMRGATPTTLYDLSLRETLFHGVQALRLTPLDPNATHGRLGLLAHTFMLGPRGDSNGCVVFRDYGAFLQAYESGAIRRLAVVAGV